MSGALVMQAGMGASFHAVTNSHSSGTGATETVPVGATQLVIECWGGGQGSQGGTGIPLSSGGNAAGYSKKTLTLTPTDWSKTFTYTVGGGGTGGTSGGGGGGSGGASTVANGTDSQSVSMTANGGSSGGGGTATGGTTNTTGAAHSGSTGGVATAGDNGYSAGGGANGVSGFSTPGATGPGGLVNFAYT